MIRNSDGTPYKLNSLLNQFDPNGPNYDFFNNLDEEIITISGSPIFYYEVLIQFQTLDRIHLEDRGKLFSPNAVELRALYEPPEQSNMQGIYSVDTPDEEVVFELNYRAVLRDLGHPPKVGSRIFTPHRGENWIILDRKLSGFQGWQAIRLQLLARKFQESLTTGDGQVAQDQPDFKLNG